MSIEFRIFCHFEGIFLKKWWFFALKLQIWTVFWWISGKFCTKSLGRSVGLVVPRTAKCFYLGIPRIQSVLDIRKTWQCCLFSWLCGFDLKQKDFLSVKILAETPSRKIDPWRRGVSGFWTGIPPKNRAPASREEKIPILPLEMMVLCSKITKISVCGAKTPHFLPLQIKDTPNFSLPASFTFTNHQKSSDILRSGRLVNKRGGGYDPN